MWEVVGEQIDGHTDRQSKESDKDAHGASLYLHLCPTPDDASDPKASRFVLHQILSGAADPYHAKICA